MSQKLTRWSLSGRHQHGVTLMELMIVVAIVGILAAVAYPTYSEYMNRGRRASGKAMLQQVLQQQERFYSENNTYTVDMADLGYGALGPYASENDTHHITLAAGPTGDILTSVAIEAAPTGVDAKCGTLTLNSTMQRGATGTTPDGCW